MLEQYLSSEKATSKGTLHLSNTSKVKFQTVSDSFGNYMSHVLYVINDDCLFFEGYLKMIIIL